jgi:hypothetical protein
MERTIPKLGRVIAQRNDCDEVTVEWVDPKTGYLTGGRYDRIDWDPLPVKGYIPKMGRVVARSRNGHQVSTVWASPNGRWRGVCHYELGIWTRPPLKLARQCDKILSRPPVFVSRRSRT